MSDVKVTARLDQPQSFQLIPIILEIKKKKRIRTKNRYHSRLNSTEPERIVAASPGDRGTVREEIVADDADTHEDTHADNLRLMRQSVARGSTGCGRESGLPR